ncbi:MAG: transposase IS200-family protein [Firmicutes bacterium]|nr:transposase IS200-family protein [Bacillota bacterium]
MPRTAREKSDDSIFHIMVRSISEVTLFRTDKDKKVYLNLMKKYQHLYHFKVFAYCLMDNHAHFVIDVNGADISDIMHCTDLSYARYFNKVHKRHGHLFQDRFKSKIVKSDRYLRTVTGYIHNNPVDLRGFKANPEKYSFSSLPVYLNLQKDPFDLLDYNFINSFFRLNVKRLNDGMSISREGYLKFVNNCTDPEKKKEFDFSGECSEYVSNINPLIRKFDINIVINYVAEKTGVESLLIYAKNSRSALNARAIAAFLLRSLCNCRCSDICRILGNITQSRASGLTRIGLDLVINNILYRDMVDEFISTYSSA